MKRSQVAFLLTVVLSLAILLLGCGGPPINEGEVLGHRYEEPYSYMRDYQVYSGCAYMGKYGCMAPIYTHYSERVYVEEKWRLRIRDCEHKRDNGECRIGFVDVSYDEYQTTTDGTYWKRKKD